MAEMLTVNDIDLPRVWSGLRVRGAASDEVDLNDVAVGGFGEAAPDTQAQKMDWRSVGPRDPTQMHCIVPATCSHTRSCGPPTRSSASKSGTMDRRSAPVRGPRPRSSRCLTSSKPMRASRPPPGAKHGYCCRARLRRYGTVIQLSDISSPMTSLGLRSQALGRHHARGCERRRSRFCPASCV
jgi:hypothetical protein